MAQSELEALIQDKLRGSHDRSVGIWNALER